MSEPKFTPGPWRVIHTPLKMAREYGVQMGPDGGFMLSDYSNPEHNAHLIAAAPELYEALEKIRHWGESQHKAQSKGGHATFDMMILREQIDTAEAALAKARGEE